MKEQIRTGEEVVEKTTDELAAEKAADLSTKLGVEVHPMIFTGKDGKPVIGYIKEPGRFVKLRFLDKAIREPVSAGMEILEACVIREETDVRIMSDRPENDVFYLGACMYAYRLVKYATDQFKKN